MFVHYSGMIYRKVGKNKRLTLYHISNHARFNSVKRSPRTASHFASGVELPFSVLCLPFTVRCPLSTIHCPLSTVHCPLSTVHCPPSTVHCPLHSVHCPPSTVHYPLAPRAPFLTEDLSFPTPPISPQSGAAAVGCPATAAGPPS